MNPRTIWDSPRDFTKVRNGMLALLYIFAISMEMPGLIFFICNIVSFPGIMIQRMINFGRNQGLIE